MCQVIVVSNAKRQLMMWFHKIMTMVIVIVGDICEES